ncbi:MAG TPA: ATP-dependent DNA helicase [Gammaproteobacteria bacterium]|jgi:Rad3-related DNA helicase
MARELKLGIRELVEFCCRGGDLGGDGSVGVRALEGVRTHQRIQQRYRHRASAEVALKYNWRIDDVEVELGGRIDLLFDDETPPRIEEIKTVAAHTDEPRGDAVHWAQLRCYGACYARLHELDEVRLCLNHVTLFERREWRRDEIAPRAELEAFVDQTLRRYLRWHALVESRRQTVREQARALQFPFAGFRPRQREFAAGVYRLAGNGGQLMVEAPTGSGKTVSTLFPALKALGEGRCEQLVYLSAKVSGQRQAVAALDRMPSGAACLVIQARARSCPCVTDPGEIDDDGRCRRCIGFFDRLPAAREALFAAGRLDVGDLQRCADEHALCPFELSLQMLPWAEIVVCDFNYVFDPLVQLGYFRSDTRRKLLLVDELHNLVDRARGMYSARLRRAQIRAARAAANGSRIDAALKAMQQALDRELRAQAETRCVTAAPPAALLRACQRFGERIGDEIFANKRIAGETLDFAREVFRFQLIAQLFGDHHRVLGYSSLPGRELKLLCLNAFEYLRDCYPMFTAICGFSATLSPPAYFRRALGLGEECRSLSLEPPFDANRLGVLVGEHIDTRFGRRESQIGAICESIAAVYRARPGNYLVFFSAYHFMQQVHEHFSREFPQIDTRLQQREFDDAAQAAFIAGFFDGDKRLGFAIMGGRFAEGIDYRGEALIGAILVGVGLPQASLEQELIREDFEALRLDGFDYAFRFPGLIRVQQSAGRVIRDERDRGVVVLLERRFRQAAYARYLPRHWRLQYCNDAESLEQSLTAFWHEAEASDAAN